MQILALLLSFVTLASAQFGFFDHMFSGGEQQQHQQPRNNPSDAGQYRSRHDSSVCDNYLCPDSLACVHFPHHCPCIWDANEDKFELGDGKRICISKGGYAPGEAGRKLELARKGLL